MRVVGELEFGRLGKLEEVPCAEIQVPKLRGAAFSNLCRFNIQQLGFIRQNIAFKASRHSKSAYAIIVRSSTRSFVKDKHHISTSLQSIFQLVGLGYYVF